MGSGELTRAGERALRRWWVELEMWDWRVYLRGANVYLSQRR